MRTDDAAVKAAGRAELAATILPKYDHDQDDYVDDNDDYNDDNDDDAKVL